MRPTASRARRSRSELASALARLGEEVAITDLIKAALQEIGR